MNRPALTAAMMALAWLVMAPAAGVADEPPSSAGATPPVKTLQTIVVAGSRGAGIVYTPAWFKGFEGTVDWYDIRLRDAIADPGF